MIPEDRLKKILALVERNQFVSVDELEAQLYVSAATIRRDLAELSKRGLIVRSFGGATAAGNGTSKPMVKPAAADDPIAKCACRLIGDRDTVFLSGSPLAEAMTAELAQRSTLTVVTDSLHIAEALCGHIAGLYCTGGRYAPNRRIFSGKQAAALTEKFCFDKSFISCDSLTPDGELGYYGVERLPVLQAVVRHSREKILLCAAEQLGASVPNLLMSLKSIDTVITDAPDKLPAGYKGQVIEAGTRGKKMPP